MRNFFFLAVVFLAGCGDVGQDGATPLLSTDGGVAYCEVPSPTGDVRWVNAGGVEQGTVRDHVMKNVALGYVRPYVVEDDSRRLCVGWTAEHPAGSDLAGNPYPAYCPARAPEAECRIHMTEEECSDAADDMLDSAGYRHCWGVAVDSVGRASLTGVGIMEVVDASINVYGEREVPVCSSGGRFLGWVCAGA